MIWVYTLNPCLLPTAALSEQRVIDLNLGQPEPGRYHTCLILTMNAILQAYHEYEHNQQHHACPNLETISPVPAEGQLRYAAMIVMCLSDYNESCNYDVSLMLLHAHLGGYLKTRRP